MELKEFVKKVLTDLVQGVAHASRRVIEYKNITLMIRGSHRS